MDESMIWMRSNISIITSIKPDNNREIGILWGTYRFHFFTSALFNAFNKAVFFQISYLKKK